MKTASPPSATVTSSMETPAGTAVTTREELIAALSAEPLAPAEA